MRKLLLPGIFLIFLFTAALSNLYLLHKEVGEFYEAVIDEEVQRIRSVVEGTLSAGGDPVEALAIYIEKSKLLKGASFFLEGREVIIPGSDISDEFYVRELKVPPFRFRLYIDTSYLNEFNKHVFVLLVSFVFFAVVFSLMVFWLLREYFREKLYLEKERQERMRIESINLVIHSLLHEIKNRLNVLALLVHRLEKFYQKDYLVRLKREVEKLGRYVEETADLRKPLNLDRKEWKMFLLIEEALSKFRDLMKEKGIEYELDLEDCTVSVDRDRIVSAIVDLLKNAVEALENVNPKRIRLAVKKENGSCIVYVMDSAAALPDGDVFKPFNTTKSKGFGLGLYNVKRTVEAHGGRVEAYVEGGWTVFKLTIPV